MSGRLKSLIFLLIITIAGSVVTCYISKIEREIKFPEISVPKISELAVKKHIPSSYLYFQTDTSKVEFLVANELGQKTGFDYYKNNNISEIVMSSYYKESMAPEGATEDQIQTYGFVLIERAMQGKYNINIYGIDNTKYNFYISNDIAKNISYETSISSSIKKGEIQNFTLTLSENGEIELKKVN